MPAKVNPTEQRKFLKNILRPLISLAKKGKVQLFFVDASHFVQGGFIGQLWSRTRIFIKATSGRRRYNVLGALNFASKTMTTITNDAYIAISFRIELQASPKTPKTWRFSSRFHLILNRNAYITSVQVMRLIDKLLIEHPNQAIAMVMDNVSYQRCNAVILVNENIFP